MGRFVKAFVLRSGISAAKLPSGSTSDRPTQLVDNGMIRYNYDDNNFEYYNDVEWRQLGQDDAYAAKDTWIADGVNTEFELTHTLVTEFNTDVYVEGIWQEQGHAVTINDHMLKFSSPPPSGMRITAITRGNVQ